MTSSRAREMEALGPARRAGFPPGEFVGQESFVTASEVLDLAVRAGIGAGTRVLDLCCGTAGPGRLLERSLGCLRLGLDADPGAAPDVVCSLPDLPVEGPFDAALLLETVLAFRDKRPLLRAVAGVLRPGGTFAFTLEEGRPLDEAEREAMPASDTVWPVPLDEMEDLLGQAGFAVQSCRELRHAGVARGLAEAYAADGERIAAALGEEFLERLLRSHRLWAKWLEAGRIRKFALVAARPPEPLAARPPEPLAARPS